MLVIILKEIYEAPQDYQRYVMNNQLHQLWKQRQVKKNQLQSADLTS